REPAMQRLQEFQEARRQQLVNVCARGRAVDGEAAERASRRAASVAGKCAVERSGRHELLVAAGGKTRHSTQAAAHTRAGKLEAAGEWQVVLEQVSSFEFQARP